jgi:Leucine-rich repeat (LRR) protein
MRNIVAVLLFCTLWSSSLYSQSRSSVFQARFTWLTLDQALQKEPESVLHLKLTKRNLSNFPANISQFKNLKSLSLQGMKLTELPQEILQFTSLSYLDLSKNKIAALPSSFCELKRIETLILNRNPIAALPFCLGELTRLTAIDLYDTEVSDLPQSLALVRTLKFVDFQGIQLRKEEIESLEQRFSWVKFFFDPPCNCFK